MYELNEIFRSWAFEQLLKMDSLNFQYSNESLQLEMLIFTERMVNKFNEIIFSKPRETVKTSETLDFLDNNFAFVWVSTALKHLSHYWWQTIFS